MNFVKLVLLVSCLMLQGDLQSTPPDIFLLLLEQHFQRRLLRALRSFADQYIVHLQKSCNTLTIDLKSD